MRSAACRRPSVAAPPFTDSIQIGQPGANYRDRNAQCARWLQRWQQRHTHRATQQPLLQRGGRHVYRHRYLEQCVHRGRRVRQRLDLPNAGTSDHLYYPVQYQFGRGCEPAADYYSGRHQHRRWRISDKHRHRAGTAGQRPDDLSAGIYRQHYYRSDSTGLVHDPAAFVAGGAERERSLFL